MCSMALEGKKKRWFITIIMVLLCVTLYGCGVSTLADLLVPFGGEGGYSGGDASSVNYFNITADTFRADEARNFFVNRHIMIFLYYWGYREVYSEELGWKHKNVGDTYTSTLASYMDIARGDYFEDPPTNGPKEGYPDKAWFHPEDKNCLYSCQATSYFIWAHFSIQGWIPYSVYDDVKNIWELIDLDELKAKDTNIFNLLTQLKFKLPTNEPDQIYTPYSDDPTLFTIEESIPDSLIDVAPDISREIFKKHLNVFDIHIIGTSETENADLIYVAKILAQFLDNDEDGQIDNLTLYNEIIVNPVVFNLTLK